MSYQLIKRVLAPVAVLGMAGQAHANVITYDTWTTNEGDTGNYVLTVDDSTAGQFAVELTINPWNAEALGLFIDLGDFDIAGAVGLSNIMPAGQVALFDTDTSSDSCGGGCNLNGLVPPLAMPDGEWELVFSLGSVGFDGIQTFSFTIDDFGLSLSDWGLVGIRAQQLCDPGETLPQGNCDGSDKSYGYPGTSVKVPEPGTALLLGAGLVLLSFGRRKLK
ncbi:MAG: PEP-CTERM sorting domain-containing protein [Gammaproteobacteria bacterium]